MALAAVFGFVVSERMQDILEWLRWPALAFGLAIVVGFYAGVFFVMRKLVRRWRKLSDRRHGRLRVTSEALGTAVFIALWVLASRVAP